MFSENKYYNVNRNTSCGKIFKHNLFVVFIIILITIAILCTGIFLIFNHFIARTNSFTPENVASTAVILNYVDDEADPCDDFYLFACGKFLKNTVIPYDKPEINTFKEIEDDIVFQLLDILEQPKKPDEPRSFDLARNYFKACINESKLEILGLEPMRRIISRMDVWPMYDDSNWDETKFDWITAVKKIRQLGYENTYMLKINVRIDSKNKSKYVLEVDQIHWDPDIKPKYLKDDSYQLKSYYNFTLDMLEFLGLDKKLVKDDVTDILDFMKKLAKISLEEDELIEINTNNPTTIDELEKKYPSIRWLEYINNVLDIDTKVKGDQAVNNRVPIFIEKFIDLINETPKKTIANYLGWRVYRASISGLPKDLKVEQYNYIKIFTGAIDVAIPWKDCISRTLYYLDAATSAMYVRKYFDNSIKEKIKEIVMDTKDAFADIIKENKWMDSKTRNYAVEKAQAIEAFIAYPDELFNNEILDEHYRTLYVDKNYYLESRLNVTKFIKDKDYELLVKPVNKSYWADHAEAAVVETYYINRKNSIEIMAGLLNGIIFQKKRPMYMNYGTLSSLVGFSLTLGFTTQGRKFDKDGQEVNWWSKEADEEFDKKSECFVEQYNNYVVPKINITLNGEKTKKNNIADNGAVKISYAAYMKWIERHGEEKSFTGVPYTTRQLFWISRAHAWCAKEKTANLRDKILTSIFTPYHFRVLGPLTNSEEFSKDFNCPVDSNMNPKKKCILF